MASIELSGITKTYDGTVALDNVELTVADGEFVALVGPSGCGKSTLLRMIAGLDRPDVGTIAIDGREITTTAAAERDIAMVFQNYALYPHLTVAQNIATPLRMRGLKAWERLPLVWRARRSTRSRIAAIDTKVMEAARSLGIEYLLARLPGQLSGGQRQRVALGRAIVREPAVFLFDEPLSNLDAELRASMRAELVDLHRRLGVASIYVTHDQVEAMTMADRIAVMRSGRVLQIGTPAELYANPSCLEVACTIGVPRIGVVEAVVASGGLKIGDTDAPIRVDRPAGEQVRLGLRAEHLRLAGGKADVALNGKVRHIEHLGADTMIHVALDDARERLIVRMDSAAHNTRLGEAVRVEIDTCRAMVFDSLGHRVTATAVSAAIVASSGRRLAHG